VQVPGFRSTVATGSGRMRGGLEKITGRSYAQVFGLLLQNITKYVKFSIWQSSSEREGVCSPLNREIFSVLPDLTGESCQIQRF
jgi:hypothetical protein